MTGAKRTEPPAAGGRMLLLGVTGGVGVGKSTVSDILAKRGARILDADGIVRELYAGDELPRAIGRRFGPGVLAADGSVDRAALGRLVFADSEALADLEKLVHPPVRETIAARLLRWRQEGFTGLAVVDSALLVETEHDYALDALLVVVARERTRLDRLQARGMGAEQARRRMDAQASDEARIARADFVIRNDGTRADLEAEIDRLLVELGRDAADLSG